MRLYLRGWMTDEYSTKSTREGMGVVEKKCQFTKMYYIAMGIRPSFAVNLRLIQELKGSVSFI